MSDMSIQIGDTAGKIWRHLRANGAVPVSSLLKEFGGDPALVYQGIGWLAREANVEFVEKGKQLMMKLPEKR